MAMGMVMGIFFEYYCDDGGEGEHIDDDDEKLDKYIALCRTHRSELICCKLNNIRPKSGLDELSN